MLLLPVIACRNLFSQFLPYWSPLLATLKRIPGYPWRSDEKQAEIKQAKAKLNNRFFMFPFSFPLKTFLPTSFLQVWSLRVKHPFKNVDLSSFIKCPMKFVLLSCWPFRSPSCWLVANLRGSSQRITPLFRFQLSLGSLKVSFARYQHEIQGNTVIAWDSRYFTGIGTSYKSWYSPSCYWQSSAIW